MLQTIDRYCNFTNLNSALENYDFSGLQTRISGYGLGLTMRDLNSSSYLSFYFTYYNVKPMKDDVEKLSQIQILEISNEFNIVLTKKSKWIFYPNIGYGINLCRLTLSDRTNELNFPESISNFTLLDSKSYSSEKPIFWGNIGIGFERKFKLLSDYLYLGMNLGYKITSSTDWGFNDSPRTNFSGFEYKVRARIEIFPKKYKTKRLRN
jgi:hypothetical protein